MTINNSNYDFILLPDEVAIQDSFEDETHRKAAQVLAKTLEASNGNITIGLEGAWGSGKSTVINMFAETIKNDNHSCLFLFDAWAHKDDPLRIIFLKGLIKEIKKKVKSQEQEQEQEIDKLEKKITHKIKKIETQLEKLVSPLGKHIAASVIFVSIGSNLSRLTSLSLSKWDNWSTFNYLWFEFYSFLIISPLLILIHWAIWGERNKSNELRKYKFLGYKKDWDILSKAATDTSKQYVSETGEKTSVEFEEYFKELTQIANKEYDIKRIVIVIDNLDRVEPDHAKSIWSTLQTFFQSRSLSQQGTASYTKIWFIVPYDREGFSAIWDKDSKENKGIAPSFLDKCFQVRVEVPQPITSGWLAYCEKCLNDALIKENALNKSELLKEYSRIVSIRKDIPTPRQIRAWTNQVAMNGFKWESEFSEKSLALYSYLRMKHTENKLKDLISNQDKNKNEEPTLNVEDYETIYEISGLLFGVRKELGKQILLKDVIIRILQERQNGTLKKLAEDHNDAFWLTWNHNKKEFNELHKSMSNNTLFFYTKYIIQDLSEIRDISTDINEIFNLWKNIIDWDLKNPKEYHVILKIMLEILKEKNIKIDQLDSIIKSYINKILSILPNAQPHNYIEEYTLTELRNLINLTNQFNYKITPKIYHHLDASNYAKWIKLQYDNNIYLPEILPNIFKSAVLSDLERKDYLLSNDINHNGLKDLIETTLIVQDSKYWNPVVHQINRVIKLTTENSNSQDQTLDLLYELIFSLISQHEFIEFKENIKRNENINFSKFTTDELEFTIPLNMLAILVFNENFGSELNWSSAKNEIYRFWKTHDENLENNVIIFLKKYNQLNLINKIARDKSLILARKILENSNEPTLFDKNSSAILYINEYYINLNRSEKSIRDMIKKICKNNGLSTTVNMEFSKNPTLYFLNFRLLLLHANDAIKSVIKNIISGIKFKDWESDFLSKKDLTLIFTSDFGLKTNNEFSDAFYSWFQKCLEKKDNDQDKIWNCFKTIESHLINKETKFTELRNNSIARFNENISERGINHIRKYIPDLYNFDGALLSMRINDLLEKRDFNILNILLNNLNIDFPLKNPDLISKIDNTLNNLSSNEQIYRNMLMQLKLKLNK